MRWRWIGTYQLSTTPRFHLEEGAPAPPSCSGYVAGGPSGITQVGPCTCCDCWVTERSTGLAIYDGGQSVSQKYEKVLVGYVPIIPGNFSDKYHLAMEQLSLSPASYNFWKLVRAQQQGAGSLFQPASVKIQGNVHSLNNPDEEVLGIFTVSAVQNRSIFIYKEDIPDPLPDYINTDDCRKVSGNNTNIRPPFW
jgi:hypothetical protein